jgi:hypothetical protein
LVGSEEELRENSVQPLDTPLELNQQDVKKVVFVIHGIRDLGYWTRKIAQRVQVLARKKEVGFRAVTSTYGYFAMLPFIWPSTRRAKVEWLMDEYAQARARYPNAKFCYVGHSNGTYMLASALQEYPCCQFEHVVFAGSVVRTDYRWDRFRENGQVKAVLNYVATSDWVVAFFPKAFELLHWQDLGSAGHDGFLAIPAEGAAGQIEYIHGSHGAALVEENWDAIADFVIEGRLPGDAPPRNLLARKRNGAIAFCGRISPLLWAVGLSIVLLLAWLILYGRIGWPGDWAPSWGRAVGLVLYAWAIKTVVTRV